MYMHMHVCMYIYLDLRVTNNLRIKMQGTHDNEAHSSNPAPQHDSLSTSNQTPVILLSYPFAREAQHPLRTLVTARLRKSVRSLCRSG